MRMASQSRTVFGTAVAAVLTTAVLLTFSGTGSLAFEGDTEEREEPLFTMQHGGPVRGATFDSDERRILTWSRDSTARLWDVGSEEPVFTMQHDDQVWGAAFDSDEIRILTWSLDGTARIWEVRSEGPLFTTQHDDAGCGATFDSDERRIFTGRLDGTDSRSVR